MKQYFHHQVKLPFKSNIKFFFADNFSKLKFNYCLIIIKIAKAKAIVKTNEKNILKYMKKISIKSKVDYSPNEIDRENYTIFVLLLILTKKIRIEEIN